jgi:hypothetical protein
MRVLEAVHEQKAKKPKAAENAKKAEKVEEVYKDVDIEGLLEVFNKWLYIENSHDITIPLAYVVSNFTKTDPGCMAIIAPSGSYKTEFLRSIGTETNEFVYPLDDFTSHTLITGMPKVRDVVPDLEGRLITVKDFTSVLSKREDERAAIFSNIRDMADGYLNKQFGSGKRVSYQGIHSSFLIATTDVLENYYSLTGILGQRIIYFRPSNNGKKAMERARKNIDCGNKMRDELHNAMMGIIASALKDKERLDNYQAGLTEKNSDMLLEYTNIAAIARTHVERDFKGRVKRTPTPEFPTRLIREIIKIIGCHAVLHRREVEEEDLQAGLKVLMDNVPPDRLNILRQLIKEPIAGFFTEEVTSALSLASHATRQRLEELLVLKIIYKETVEGKRSDKWRIVPEYRGAIQGFLNKNTEIHRGVNPICSIYENKVSPLICSIYPVEYCKKVIRSNTKKLQKDERDTGEKSYIYSILDLPPHVFCAGCNEKKKHMSLYGETLYCDNCLEAILEDEEAKAILKAKEAENAQKTLDNPIETENLTQKSAQNQNIVKKAESNTIGQFNPEVCEEDKRRYAQEAL